MGRGGGRGSGRRAPARSRRVSTMPGITGFEAGALSAHDPEHAALADCRAVHAVQSRRACSLGLQARDPRHASGGGPRDRQHRLALGHSVGIPGRRAYASSKSAIRNPHPERRPVLRRGRRLKHSRQRHRFAPAAFMTPDVGGGARLRAPTAPPPRGQPHSADLCPMTALRAAPRKRSPALRRPASPPHEAPYMTGAELRCSTGGFLAGRARRAVAGGGGWKNHLVSNRPRHPPLPNGDRCRDHELHR